MAAAGRDVTSERWTVAQSASMTPVSAIKARVHGVDSVVETFQRLKALGLTSQQIYAALEPLLALTKTIDR